MPSVNDPEYATTTPRQDTFSRRAAKITGVIVLNLALYELFAPVDRPLARLADLNVAHA